MDYFSEKLSVMEQTTACLLKLYSMYSQEKLGMHNGLTLSGFFSQSRGLFKVRILPDSRCDLYKCNSTSNTLLNCWVESEKMMIMWFHSQIHIINLIFPFCLFWVSKADFYFLSGKWVLVENRLWRLFEVIFQFEFKNISILKLLL